MTDKVADRIAGAIVDLGYKTKQPGNPRIAVEVLAGHGECNIIIESSVNYKKKDIKEIVNRILGKTKLNLKVVPQDVELAKNQEGKIRCGDNGIMKGVPVDNECRFLTMVAKRIYDRFGTDGKYVYNEKTNELIICQSNATEEEIRELLSDLSCNMIINPLGYWTGGYNVDCGCTNRKLGSDMGESATGGGICAKDISKADVSVNIYCFEKAQEKDRIIEGYCSIGSEYVTINEYSAKAKKLIVSEQVPFSEIVDFAYEYIMQLGGFEKFSEWGLIR